MILEKISQTEYEVTLYDWVTDHNDYVAGSIKRYVDNEGLLLGDVSDSHYWMFYLITTKPINFGDLRRICAKVGELNEEL